MFSGCEKIENMTTYTIEGGKHYSNERKIVAVGNKIDFRFYVHKNWIYPAKHDVGWSKLIGLSHNVNVHANSGRIAWRCRGGEHIRLAGYFYLNKHRYVYEFDRDYEIGEWYYGSVWFDDGYYNVMVDGEVKTHEFHWRDGDGTFFLCHPYFGGEQPAPHWLTFYFEWL